MIGWWVVIAAQTPEERDAATDRKAAILAQWDDGVSGIRWLERLAEEGKATKLRGNGYPNRYTARAGDVLPLLEQVKPTRRHSNIEMHAERIADCLPEQVLTIDAWDQD